MIEQVEQVVRQSGGTLGLLAITILLLVKEVIRGKNEKGCPIADSEGTPLSEERHDKMCDLKLAPIVEGIHRIEAEVKELPKKLNGGTKK